MRVFLLMGLALTLISCGQYGDLYLSQSQEAAAKKGEKKPWSKKEKAPTQQSPSD